MIISNIKSLKFGNTVYDDASHLYQTVIVIRDENEIVLRLMIDEVNGYVKWQQDDGRTVRQVLDEGLRYLINQETQGDGSNTSKHKGKTQGDGSTVTQGTVLCVDN